MRQVVLDTDVASLIIKQRLPAALLREIVGAQAGITFVTLGELTRLGHVAPMGRPATRRAQHLVGSAPHAPLHRRHRPHLGRDLRPRDTPRPPTTPERHLDRRLLPGLRPAPRHTERVKDSETSPSTKAWSSSAPDDQAARSGRRATLGDPKVRSTELDLLDPEDGHDLQVATERTHVPAQHVDTGQLTVLDLRCQR